MKEVALAMIAVWIVLLCAFWIWMCRIYWEEDKAWRGSLEELEREDWRKAGNGRGLAGRIDDIRDDRDVGDQDGGWDVIGDGRRHDADPGDIRGDRGADRQDGGRDVTGEEAGDDA